MTEFRTATKAELHQILGWAADEGWNPGLDDAAAFHASDPAGFFVATEDGVPVASISVVNHTDDFAFLGLYIVDPAFRGKGIGHGLWQHAIAHAQDRTIGLDAVPEQQDNYAASGFCLAGSTTRFSGLVSPLKTPAIRRAKASDIPDMISREAKASGVSKDAYLSAWLTDTPSRTTLVDKEGFCTVRRCQSGAKVGPLFARTEEAALGLMQSASAIMGPDLIIDVPASSKSLTQLCRQIGLGAGFETARMYRGHPPSTEVGIFAVTSLELG